MELKYSIDFCRTSLYNLIKGEVAILLALDLGKLPLNAHQSED